MPEIGGVRGERAVPHYGSVAQAREPLETEAAGPLNKANETASRIEKIAAEVKVRGGELITPRGTDGSLRVEQIYSQGKGLGNKLDIDG